MMDTTQISSISARSSTQVNTAGKTDSTQPTAAAASTAADTNPAVQRQDSYVRSYETTAEDTGIYSKESISQAIESAEERRAQTFINMLQQMLGRQGEHAVISEMELNEAIRQNFTQEDLDAATASISEGGEYSVDAVATRIMDFAKALSGNDPSKIGLLRESVQKGFGLAAEMFGRELEDMPEITQQTYNEIMSRFDEWEESFRTDTEETAEAAAE